MFVLKTCILPMDLLASIAKDAVSALSKFYLAHINKL